MTDLPTVTIAQPSDEESLMALCRNLHKENGLFSFDDDKVRKLLRQCYARQSDAEPPTLVGIIREDGRIIASICLMVSDFYYTHDWHLGELWTYVDPGYRNSRNAEALIEFGKVCAVKMKLPYITGIITEKSTAGKARLYRRLLGHAAGAFFIYNANWKPEPMQDHSALRHRLKELAVMCAGKKVTFEMARKEIGPVLREAAEAIGDEDSLWSNRAKANGSGARPAA